MSSVCLLIKFQDATHTFCALSLILQYLPLFQLNMIYKNQPCQNTDPLEDKNINSSFESHYNAFYNKFLPKYLFLMIVNVHSSY